jgi:hypothetical protein
MVQTTIPDAAVAIDDLRYEAGRLDLGGPISMTRRNTRQASRG